MFLLNSCLSLFSAACSRRHPFSRSYGVILPSSLTMLLPSALGFSPHPPVSVYGTGLMNTIVAFLDSDFACFATILRSTLRYRIFLFRLRLCPCVPTVLIHKSAGIYTCCPSTTLLSLALGPDLTGADQLYPGNLGYSAIRILTLFSLLIPAFSLPIPPQLLSVLFRRNGNAPLPIMQSMIPKLRCRV